METSLSEKERAELVKFIDDILYHDEGDGVAVIPFRSLALSEKYVELSEMEMEVDLLMRKLGKLSKTAIKRYKEVLDETHEPLETMGMELSFDPDELRRIRLQLVA